MELHTQFLNLQLSRSSLIRCILFFFNSLWEKKISKNVGESEILKYVEEICRAVHNKNGQW